MKEAPRSLVLVGGTGLPRPVGAGTAAKSLNTEGLQFVDTRRETQIQTTFDMNPHLREFNLNVLVDGNKAVLGGNVDNGVARELAEQITLVADDILQIDNRILVDADYVRPARTTNERTFSERVDDATTTASIKSRLLWSSHTSGLDIRAETVQGKVTLTGMVAGSPERDHAERIARNTQGVIALRNDIVLARKSDMDLAAADTGAERSMPDSWITDKVNKSLMFTRGVSGANIAVATLEGVVWLGGIVQSTVERELAIEVAGETRGVRNVEAGGLTVERNLVDDRSASAERELEKALR